MEGSLSEGSSENLCKTLGHSENAEKAWDLDMTLEKDLECRKGLEKQ